MTEDRQQMTDAATETEDSHTVCEPNKVRLLCLLVKLCLNVTFSVTGLKT